jgi:hypothetical protein
MAKGKVKHGEARAEARRRNRLAAKERVVAEATGGLATASDSNASVATKISPTTISAAQGTRTGFRAALRSSFGAAPIRADIAFFPTLVPTRVLVVPLIIAAATSYLAVQPGALASSWLQIAVQSLLLPPAFVLSFLGGMLTRRASWLAGGVIGLMTLAGGTFVAGSADLGAMEATNPVRLVLEIYARTSADLGSVASNAYGAAVMGIFGGAFAGWYGRFLRAAGPGPRSARERRRVEAERRKGSDR